MRKTIFPTILFVSKHLEQVNFKADGKIENVVYSADGDKPCMVATYKLVHIKKYTEQLKIVCLD